MDSKQGRPTKSIHKDIKLTVKLDIADVKALNAGMNKVGETNKSSYIRRLIHENRGF